MNLDECRKRIDEIDSQLRELLMQRMDCSLEVAKSKKASGDLTIYRADRERAILERLGEGIPADRKPEYLAVVRKVMEASRMYQYGKICQWDEGLFNQVQGSELALDASKAVRVRLTRPNCAGALAPILAMVGDYGFNLAAIEQIAGEPGSDTATFELTILGDISAEPLRVLIYQLAQESTDFQILEIISAE